MSEGCKQRKKNRDNETKSEKEKEKERKKEDRKKERERERARDRERERERERDNTKKNQVKEKRVYSSFAGFTASYASRIAVLALARKTNESILSSCLRSRTLHKQYKT